jgi:hypothetical protein
MADEETKPTPAPTPAPAPAPVEKPIVLDNDFQKSEKP